jgi:hypothetical protein
MTAALTIVVTTNIKSLDVHVDAFVRPVSSSGTLANALLDVEFPCDGCTPGEARGRGALLSGWKADGYTSFDFIGGLGTGRDRVANHGFHPRFRLDGGRIVKDGTGSSFRCDGSPDINSGPGCIFPQTHPTMVFRTTGKGSAAGLHIQLALTHPNDTHPVWTGAQAGKKTIPWVLHRLVNPSKQRENGRASQKVCLADDPKYAKKLLDCDEYPFKSTQEGAAKGDGRFSALAIPRRDNRSAGNVIADSFAGFRILDGEEFHVAVAP